MSTTFIERNNLTMIITEKLNELFDEKEVDIIPFGVEQLFSYSNALESYFSKLEVNINPSAMMLKFAPDYIIFKKTNPEDVYFLEVKCSITPLIYEARYERVKANNLQKKLNRSNIGNIAREALLSYNRFFPKTIILEGSSYNSKVLMAQFSDKVDCLYCYNKSSDYSYCENCPSKNGGFFDLEKMNLSRGSKTPNTNINLDSFYGANDFFYSLGISLNSAVYMEIVNKIKSLGVNLGRIEERKKEIILNELYNQGCDWLGNKCFSTSQNYYYHFNRECSWLKTWMNREEDLIEYENENSAIVDNKKKCKMCYL